MSGESLVVRTDLLPQPKILALLSSLRRRVSIKAKELLNQLDLDVMIFDWDRIVGRIDGEPAGIPDHIQDLADFSPDQLAWLRGKGWL